MTIRRLIRRRALFVLVAPSAVPVGPPLPELSDTARAALAAARSDRDIGDEAFRALLDDVGAWPTNLEQASIAALPTSAETEPPPPGTARRVVGTLERVRPVEGLPGVEEWAVRLASGTPQLVYLDPHGAAAAPGAEVVVPARFYRELTLRDGDGHARTWRAFVGARPQLPPRDDPGASFARTGLLVGVIVGALALVFVVVARRSQRTRTARRAMRRARIDGLEIDPDVDLPDDPAEALRTLRGAHDGPDGAV